MDASTPSSILDLPPEVRLMIYDFAFQALPQQFAHSKNVKDLEPTNLLQVCREVRTEAVPQYEKAFKGMMQELYFAHLGDNKTTAGEDDETGAHDIYKMLENARQDLQKIILKTHASCNLAKYLLILEWRCKTRANKATTEYIDKTGTGIDNINTKVAKSVASYEAVMQDITAVQAGSSRR